jgi:PPOX class probable F420-dependent enzyme
MFSETEWAYVSRARVGRLATADARGRPTVVPVCFAMASDDRIVSAIDEKPKSASPNDLRRVRDIRATSSVALVVDHYHEDWDRLGWVQIRGSAVILEPGEHGHSAGVDALTAKYDQYATHDLVSRPVIEISPGSVRSWGSLTSR